MKGNRLSPEALKDVKAPALILDALWQEHFRDRKTDRINSLEAKAKGLMMENARNREEERSLDAKKKECLRKILILSEDASNGSSDAKKAIALCQTEILNINKQLQTLEKRSLTLPIDLDQANRDLLLETVSIIYVQLRESQSRLRSLEPEAERLRRELERVIIEQSKAEEDAARTYQLLHNLVGQDIVDMLDNLYGRG
jgi:hypothetical protein